MVWCPFKTPKSRVDGVIRLCHCSLSLCDSMDMCLHASAWGETFLLFFFLFAMLGLYEHWALCCWATAVQPGFYMVVEDGVLKNHRGLPIPAWVCVLLTSQLGVLPPPLNRNTTQRYKMAPEHLLLDLSVQYLRAADDWYMKKVHRSKVDVCHTLRKQTRLASTRMSGRSPIHRITEVCFHGNEWSRRSAVFRIQYRYLLNAFTATFLD